MFVDKKEPQVTSLLELLAIIIAACALLYLFAPKERITQASLILNRHLLKKPFYLSLSYKIHKTKWLNAPKGEAKDTQTKKLQQMMKQLLTQNDPLLYTQIEQDAKQFNFPHIRYEAMKKKLSIHPFNTPKHLLDLYNLAIGIQQSGDALKFFQQQYNKTPSKELGTQLATSYAQNKSYDKAATRYQRLYRDYHDSSFFLASIEHYFNAKQKDTAIKLLDKEAKNFYHDDNMSKKIINLYLAHGYTKKAHTYTLKQLQKRDIL